MSADDGPLADISTMVASIQPMDTVESSHLADASAWLDGTDDVFRRRSDPTEPAKHLVSYFLPVDLASGHVLLGDHRKSGLWLPPGGHVEPGEHPADTVRRECLEELGVEARFHRDLGPRPLLLTVTDTRPERPDQHTDVSLWFVLSRDHRDPLAPDEREYAGVRWWTPAEIRSGDPRLFDPHMGRMLEKLTTLTA
ncbi:ADP-ribose pyrophosphatase YjhB (NUDIX family) [Nocardioides albertanoniae]|uniref:ADP-ribose pyrophosphatase YjhB (NUDIX family) n=1 Tax=Nocardioides albertanoniae TaxID=1175486 RepID=A0A543A774_9ACTN|nr:NUDIX hydrolase [Nocardioides albertanoniae]TQL68326.1 ADP-ribose pyrophosphatase YjhB (NUDIX family) [Nocardioides albertanoniae]